MADHPEYTATIVWARDPSAPFVDRRYSRDHEWRFDGITVPASSSPLTVRPPLSGVDRIDPEEALLGAASSCHMLFFLFHAARRGLVVDRYEDEVTGEMGKNDAGKVAMLRIVMRPRVTFGGDAPVDAATLHELHERSHDDCYIAHSLRSAVVIEPR